MTVDYPTLLSDLRVGDRVVLGDGAISLHFTPSNMPPDAAERSLRLFSRDVMPRHREHIFINVSNKRRPEIKQNISAIDKGSELNQSDHRKIAP